MIPAFSVSGVLPPFTGEGPTQRASVSPFPTEMAQLVQRFGTTAPRSGILLGLLDYRRELRKLGIVNGYQWIDGSFVEAVEEARSRPPEDVDVVTVAWRPEAIAHDAEWSNLIQANLSLFEPRKTKQIYKVDGYFIDLNKPPEFIIEDTVYWFGLFSHQRQTALWKGLLRVPLISDDSDARRLLEALDA